MHHAALAPRALLPGAARRRSFYAAAVESFLATSSWNRLWGERDRTLPHDRAQQPVPRPRGSPASRSPAASCSGSAGSGRAARRSPSLALGLAAVLVALGPEVRAFGRSLGPGPFALLRELVPVFQMIRVTSRAGVFLALPLAMLAAKALAALRLRACRDGAGHGPRPGRDPHRSHSHARVDARSSTRGASRRRSTAGSPTSRAGARGRTCPCSTSTAWSAGRVPREHLHGVLDAPLEAARQRLRGHRARALREAARAGARLPVARAPRPPCGRSASATSSCTAGATGRSSGRASRAAFPTSRTTCGRGVLRRRHGLRAHRPARLAPPRRIERSRAAC